MRWLLDVDVVLDVLADREPWVEHSARVLGLVEQGRAEGIVAAHSVTTLYYLISTRRSTDEARRKVRTLLRVVGVAAVDEDRLERALDLPIRDYEDAVQAACALGEGAEVLITRNVSDYGESGLEVLSPPGVLARIEA